MLVKKVCECVGVCVCWLLGRVWVGPAQIEGGGVLVGFVILVEQLGQGSPGLWARRLSSPTAVD